MSWTAQSLKESYPLVPWRKPIELFRTDGAHCFGCRVCIATHGMKAEDVSRGFPTEEACNAHIEKEHKA